MPKPRILIIENSTHVTGALKSITRAAYNMQSFFDFIYVIPKKSICGFWIKKNEFYEIHELPMLELSRRFSSLILYIPLLVANAFRLISIIKQKRIALIHVNDVYNLIPVVVRLLGNSVPYVCHIRFMPDRFPIWIFKIWLKLHLRYAENIIVVSKSVLNLLPQHPKISMIYDGLPLKEVCLAEKTKFSSKPNFIFLYLSNFMVGKGQDLALEAFSLVHENLHNWKIRFVGSEMGLKKNIDYIKKLRSRAEELNIEAKIEWGEFANDVESEYRQADIVLNFSESESFSLTCLEALYYGKLLIAADCGGPSEIIDHGLTGILVPNKNIKEMAKAMENMAIELDKNYEMGFAAHKAVREKFSVEKTSCQIMDIYNQIIQPKLSVN